MDRRYDLAGSLAAMVVGIVAVTVAIVTPDPPIVYDLLGHMGVPIAIGTAIAGLGALQSWRAWRALQAGRVVDIPEGTEDDERYPSDTRRAMGFIFGSFLYLALFNLLGYLIATPIFGAAGLWALGYRSKKMVAIVMVTFTLLTFWIFSQIMSIPLPVGPLRGPMIDLGIITRFR